MVERRARMEGPGRDYRRARTHHTHTHARTREHEQGRRVGGRERDVEGPDMR